MLPASTLDMPPPALIKKGKSLRRQVARDLVTNWLARAHVNDQCVYHVGRLQNDRQNDVHLATVALTFLQAFYFGLAELKQLQIYPLRNGAQLDRFHQHDYVYIARRTAEAIPTGFPFPDQVPEEDNERS